MFQIGQAIWGGVTFADLGMTNATVFFVATYRASREYRSLGHIVATSLVSLYLIAIPIALVIWIAAPRLVSGFKVGPAVAHDAKIVFRLVAVQLTLMPITSIAVAQFKGLQKFGTSTAIVVGASVTTSGAAVGTPRAGNLAGTGCMSAGTSNPAGGGGKGPDRMICAS